MKDGSTIFALLQDWIRNILPQAFTALYMRFLLSTSVSAKTRYRSVSYTHLDVYKRQILHSQCTYSGSLLDQCIHPMKKGTAACKYDSSVYNIRSQDVYKRQKFIPDCLRQWNFGSYVSSLPETAFYRFFNDSSSFFSKSTLSISFFPVSYTHLTLIVLTGIVLAESA